MALFKKISAPGKYQDFQAIPDLIAYITRADKTPSQFIYGSHVDMQDMANSMIAVSEQFGKNSRLRLHHFILTFQPKDIKDFSVIPQIMERICGYIGQCYQIVAALHEDTSALHIHFVFNAVSFVNGYKYRGGKEEYRELVETIGSILYSYGIHPLIPVKYYPQTYHPHE